MKHLKETGRLHVLSQQAESLVDELQDALDADAVEEGRLEALKEQLTEAKEEIAFHERTYGDFVEAKDKNNESVRSTRDKMATLDERIKDAEAKVNKTELKATACANQRSAALRDKNAAIEATEKEQRIKEQYERQREDQVEIVESFIAQANDHCPRVPVDEGETGDSIERKFEKLRKDLAAAEKRYRPTS